VVRAKSEHEVRYTGNERFLVITMSRASGVTKVLYGLVVGESGPKIRQEFSSAYSRSNFSGLCGLILYGFRVVVSSVIGQNKRICDC